MMLHKTIPTYSTIVNLISVSLLDIRKAWKRHAVTRDIMMPIADNFKTI